MCVCINVINNESSSIIQLLSLLDRNIENRNKRPNCCNNDI